MPFGEMAMRMPGSNFRDADGRTSKKVHLMKHHLTVITKVADQWSAGHSKKANSPFTAAIAKKKLKKPDYNLPMKFKRYLTRQFANRRIPYPCARWC